MILQDTMTEKEEEEESPTTTAEEAKGDADMEENTPSAEVDKEEGDEKTDKDGQGEEGGDKEGEEKKPKIDPKDWPLRGITEHSDNDVLFGRGGGTNHAKGNKRYRKMVEDRKLEYVNSKRLDKPLVALEIIRFWRAQDPPGRFLKLDSNGTWSDVGDKKAREKTSQALREKAPLIRKQQEEERLGTDGDEEHGRGEEKGPSTKNTRFAEGTNTESKGGVRKAVLARDHSLGREYLQAGETMNLEGFSWRDPLNPSRAGSQGSLPPPPGEFPAQRMNSGGSLGMPHPSEYRVSSNGPPPPPAEYFHRTPTEEYGRQNYQNAPVMPGYSGYGPHHRSGSWTHNSAHAMPPLRENSLSHNPLRNASATHTAPLDAFGRSGSGYWGAHPPQPPPGQQPYAGHYRDGSGTYPHPPQYNPNGTHPLMQPPPPPAPTGQPYGVDPAIAKSWSGQSDEDISKMYDNDMRAREATQPQPSFEIPGFDHDRNDQSDLPRPEIVKRMTSNQNETLETKPDLVGPSVKRCALNRDNSLASNRLKAAHLPDYYNKDGKFDPVSEIDTLTDNMEQSRLGSEKPQPESLGSQQRTSTLDNIAAEMMGRPSAITDNSRSSTIEALDLDNLESDPVIKPNGSSAIPKPSALSANNRISTMEACFATLEEVTAKPLALTGADRVSTRDYLDLGDEPLSEGDFDRLYENDM